MKQELLQIYPYQSPFRLPTIDRPTFVLPLVKPMADPLFMLPDEALSRLRQDPIVFSRVVLNFLPWSFQEQILRDEHKRLIGVCGRQIGKSTISAVKAIWFASTHPNTTTIIVSASLRQSMETFDKVVQFLTNSILISSITRRTLTQVYLSNGARIICLPSGRTGRTLHGLTVHFAIIDEAAMVSDTVISEAVFPMLLTTKGIIWMMTTPLDKEHITYRVFSNGHLHCKSPSGICDSWSVYHFPSTISPLISEADAQDYRIANGEDKYRRQILAEFIDDADSYFPMSLLRQCIGGRLLQTNELAEYVKQHPKSSFFAGIDPGGKLSYAAIVIIERTSGSKRLKVIYYHLTKQTSDEDTIYTRQVVEASDIHKIVHFSKVCVDMTGLGGPIVEHAKELRLPVEGVGLQTKTRQDVLSHLRVNLMEANPPLIEIPDDHELLIQLNSIKYTRSRSEAFLFEKREGSYDDLGYGTGLAAWAARFSGTVVNLNK